MFSSATLARDSHNLRNYQKQTLVIKNVQQAARLVKINFGGKILKVSRHQNNGRISFRVKFIKKDGRIRSVVVDAHSGKIR
jgi:uncharacterized membrane protein YkoI